MNVNFSVYFLEDNVVNHHGKVIDVSASLSGIAYGDGHYSTDIQGID